MPTDAKVIPMPALAGRSSSRNIVTVYYEDARRRKLVRSNMARWANNAVRNAVDHMQTNDYGAALAEVYDGATGELHAIIKFHMGLGKIEILFKREVKKIVRE